MALLKLPLPLQASWVSGFDPSMETWTSLQRPVEDKKFAISSVMSVPLLRMVNLILFATMPFISCFQILTKKRLPTRKGDIHYRTSIQFLEKPEPFCFWQILVHITRTGKMVTVSATQIASVCYVQIHGSWGADYFHDKRLATKTQKFEV